MYLFHKILSGMANSEDPDQTTLFVYAILLEKLVYIILGPVLYSVQIFN